MVEGQEGVSWDEWIALGEAVERAGLEGLFRSDHYVSTINETGLGSLDAWATLAGLAAVTKRIRLGTMVSPATFRHPSILAKMTTTVDHISGGRVELGMGAGWFEKEHTTFGFDFPATSERMEILAEQIEIVHGEWSEDVFSFDGAYYSLEEVHALPKPVQQPHPPLIVGGSGGAKSIALAARWADEYNTLFATSDEVRRRRSRLDEAFEKAGRDPSQLTLSMMTTCIVGADESELEQRVANVLERTGNDSTPQEYIEKVAGQRVVGTLEQAEERLRSLENAGLERIMLQHLNHTDLDMVAQLGTLASQLA